MGIGSLLNQTGGKSFKFDQVGATVTGTVESAEVVQKKNFDSGEPEFWDDGKPIEQVRIVLQTNLRDQPDDATGEDDGLRAVYVKGWGDQLRELRRAVKASGADDIEAGGTFTATYTGDGEVAKGKRGFPPKVYAYEYRKPSGTAGLIGGQEQAAPAAQPQQQAAPAPVAGQPTAEQLAAFQAYMASQGQQAG